MSKLVKFVGRAESDAGKRRAESLAYIDNDFEPDEEKKASTASHDHDEAPDFVDLSHVKTDYTYASPTGRTSSVNRSGVTELDMDLARLEHVESVHSRPNGRLYGIEDV